jgi:uncharacterized protein YjbI with pentapeptide repeats
MEDVVLKSSEDNIYKHIKNDYNRKNKFSACNNVKMDADLKNIIFYNASFKKCKWFGCDLTNSSANGNVFSQNDFQNSHIDNVSMQHCRFSEEVFYNCTFRGSNFTHSTFHYSILENCEIHGCSFREALFSHIKLINNKITSSDFELCRFQNTRFENINLSSLNLRYSFFEHITMHKVTLPFLQMPYTFNGLQFVFQTDDEIDFESREKEENGTISYKRYTRMLPDLIAFFQERQEYFPLANCYDVHGDSKRAQESNITGIKQCVLSRDFRLLYYYCLQAACILRCTQKTRAEIYKKINHDLQGISLSPAEYYQFGYYFPMIKKLLLDNPGDKPTLSVSMRTNIETSDYEGLGYFLHLLETLQDTDTLHLDGQHIEVRRNSPAIIDWFSSGGAETLFALLQKTYSVLQPLLQDTANIVTIMGLTAILNPKFTPLIPEKKTNKTFTDSVRSDITTSTDSSKAKMEGQNEKNLTETHKINMLRNEIKNFFQPDIESVDKRFLIPDTVTVPSIKKKKLTQRINELQRRGIQILDLNVQILDGEKNILEHLYQQFFNQYYQGNT